MGPKGGGGSNSGERGSSGIFRSKIGRAPRARMWRGQEIRLRTVSTLLPLGPLCASKKFRALHVRESARPPLRTSSCSQATPYRPNKKSIPRECAPHLEQADTKDSGTHRAHTCGTRSDHDVGRSPPGPRQRACSGRSCVITSWPRSIFRRRSACPELARMPRVARDASPEVPRLGAPRDGRFRPPSNCPPPGPTAAGVSCVRRHAWGWNRPPKAAPGVRPAKLGSGRHAVFPSRGGVKRAGTSKSLQVGVHVAVLGSGLPQGSLSWAQPAHPAQRAARGGRS